METSSVYDVMATGYLTPGRFSTTTLFRQIQRQPLRDCLRIAHERIGWYSEMKYLVVGPGPHGNVEELFGLHRCVGPYLDEINPADITYLDVSAVVLDLCHQRVTEQASTLYPGSRAGQFLQCPAEILDSQVELESQDVVFAALCDHLNQDAFFESCLSVLKPGGALITSYPAEGINRIIREKIYEIDPRYTRFTINGVAYMVPSHLMTVAALESLYAAHAYTNVHVIVATNTSGRTSRTVQQAVALANVNPETVPLVIVGIGFKEA